MKKILIVNNNMHIGGVQKALLSLLRAIEGRYDITLLLFHKGGEYMQQLPAGVKVITPNSLYCCLGMTKYDKLSATERFCRGVLAGMTKLFGRKCALALMGIGQRKLEGYDVAISYLHNGGNKLFYGGCNDFVLKFVQAEKKISFLHGDFRLCGANTPENAKQYEKFDVVAACSKGCADSFLQAHPQMGEKVRVVPNCHSFEDIWKKAEEAAQSLSDRKINVVTVARLGKEKGVERGVQAIAALGAAKEKLHYYVIGDGIQKPVLQQIIEQENLSHCVTLCGMMENPYGYIKAADLLLIPSYSEAAPLVIGEAACLGTPVLSTRTSSAVEMIQSKGIGWVCENSVGGMEEKLRKLLDSPAALEEVTEHLKEIKSNNEAALSAFANMIDE